MALVDEVTQTMVAGLLQQRQPDILETADPDQVARFEARVAGAAVEVVLIAGDPADAAVRALAVEAIVCQTGSEIEYAEYPEQQAPGDVGRGYHLHQRYLELMRLLRERVLNGPPPDGGGDGALAPQGTFPPSSPYPDAAETRPACW